MSSRPFLIPGGREKDMPVQEASPSTLTYWIDRISATLDAGKSRDAERDRGLVAAMKAALAVRQVAPAADNTQRPADKPATTTRVHDDRQQQFDQNPEPRSATATALSRAEVQTIAGSYTSPSDVSQLILRLDQRVHLISPHTSCPELPEGFAIAATAVWIDLRDTYGIPNKYSADRGLDKRALHKIAAAAGVDWSPHLCRRLDNGSDPFYVHYQAVARIQNFDGTWRMLPPQSVEVDLREGSQEVKRARDAAQARTPPEEDKETPIARKFILRVAESKAMNRVIRTLGVATKYTADDLQRPFVVLKLMFTGRTSDPELKKLFATMIVEQHLKGSHALYGSPPAAFAATAGHAPPPVSDGNQDYDDDESYPGGPDDEGYDPDSTE